MVIQGSRLEGKESGLSTVLMLHLPECLLLRDLVRSVYLLSLSSANPNVTQHHHALPPTKICGKSHGNWARNLFFQSSDWIYVLIKCGCCYSGQVLASCSCSKSRVLRSFQYVSSVSVLAKHVGSQLSEILGSGSFSSIGIYVVVFKNNS